MKLGRNTSAAKQKADKAPKPARRARKNPAEGRASSGKARGRKKFILILGDEGAILVFMQGNTVLRRLFAASPQPDHTEAVLDLLQNNPTVPFYLLVDVLDQQYVRHLFPPVSSLSVSNLVKRRLSRDFQDEDLTGSIQLGREKAGRKEWQYLLIALANTPLIQQWLDLLVEQPNEFKGVFLTPVEGQNYIKLLHKTFSNEKPLSWQLLVSHHKVSGFRQIVLRDGKLAFTRVTQAIDDDVAAVIAGNIEQEIINTLEYLKRLGLAENHTLELIAVVAQEVQEALDLKRFAAGQSIVLTPLEVAEALKFEQAALSADRFGDVVMAAAFARSKPQLKLMTAYGQKLGQLYNARRGIKALGALAVLALLGMSVMNLLQVSQSGSAVEQTEAQRRPVQQQLANVRQAVEGLNKDVAFKSAIMLTHDAYMSNIHPPKEFIDTLAPLLGPDVRVRSMLWGPPGVVSQQAVQGLQIPASTRPNLPHEMQVDLEFVGQYPDTEALAFVVQQNVKQIREAMPAYEVINQPYPWESRENTNLEISFDQQAQQQPEIREGDNKITLIFRGPDPAATPPSAPAPGGQP